MAGLQPLSTRAFGPRLRRLTALTALATRPLIATKRSTARCGQSVCKCHAEKFRSAIFARILTAVHTWQHPTTGEPVRFGFSTIEHWYYRALKERTDPVGVLRRKVRANAGRQHAISDAARQAVLAQ